MWTDPILEETRGLRESYALEHNHDIDAIFKDIQKRQSATGRKLISRLPRKPRLKLKALGNPVKSGDRMLGQSTKRGVKDD